MKTNILRTACLAISIFLMSSFAIKAQTSFYDTKEVEGKVVSRTKYVMGNYGINVPESVSKYTYSEDGELLKKEVFIWNPKYDWNDKTERYNPDFNESNWTLQYCILYGKDMISDFASVELCIWNKKAKAYDLPIETMIFQLKDANHFNYLAFLKGDKCENIVGPRLVQDWVKTVSRLDRKS